MEKLAVNTQKIENPLLCQLCLGKEDLIRITTEKERLINSLLNIQLTKRSTSRLCINCTSALTCFDKFQKNSLAAQKILERSRSHRQPFLTILNGTDVDDYINSAFDTVLNWLTDVNVILRHCPSKVDAAVESLSISSEGRQVNESPPPDSSSYPENEELDIHFQDVEMLQDEEVLCEVKTEFDVKEQSDESGNEENFEMLESSHEDLEEVIENIIDQSQKEPSTVDVGPVDQSSSEDQRPLQKIEDNFDPADYFDKRMRGKRRPYKCNECGQHYSRAELIYHRYTHSGLKPYKCFYEGCKLEYNNPHFLLKHLRVIHKYTGPSQRVTDPDADLSLLESDNEVGQYMVKSLRGQKRSYECPECKKIFARMELKHHLNVHKNLRPFKCVVENCTRSFMSPRDMAVHAKRIHNIIVKAPQQRFSAKAVTPSTPKATPETESYVVCPVCGKNTSKKHFNTHLKIHDKPDMSCPFKETHNCAEIFKNRHRLTTHIKRTHDPSYVGEFAKPANIICELCGKHVNSITLKYHMNEHLGLAPYVCNIENCGKSFVRPNQLRAHTDSSHLKIKRCPFCPAKFSNQADYDQHKTENCAVKTVECEECGRQISKQNLKKHLVVHTGERNHVCPEDDCGKRFLLKYKLKLHMKTHSTEDYLKCDWCKATFTHPKWLRSHIEKKHPDKL